MTGLLLAATPYVMAANGGSLALPGWAQILTGAAAIVAAIGAITGSRAGRRQEARQDRAKTILDDRVQTLEELKAVNAAAVADADRARARLTEEEDRHGRDRERWQGELARAVSTRAEVEERCARQVSAVLDALETLRSIVRDEVARSAAQTVGDDAREHLAEHDQSTAEGAP